MKELGILMKRKEKEFKNTRYDILLALVIASPNIIRTVLFMKEDGCVGYDKALDVVCTLTEACMKVNGPLIRYVDEIEAPFTTVERRRRKVHRWFRQRILRNLVTRPHGRKV